MPIYEYRCADCNRVSSFFTRSISSALTPLCRHCQSENLNRRMSSFALGKTTQSVHAQSPARGGGSAPDFYSDPRNIGRNVEESFARHGLAMPDSVRENISAAREGALPKGLDL